MLLLPRCRIYSLASFCNRLETRCGSISSFRLLALKANGLEGGYSKRFIRRPLSTKAGGRSKTSHSSETANIRDGILDNKFSASSTMNVNKIEATEFLKLQRYNIQQLVSGNKDLDDLVTVIVFDLETTGLSRERDQIIEIALQDLRGGKNSTFQSLVNPGRHVTNWHIHGITTDMVCRPEVPRMEELISILLQFVRSRQKPNGYVLFVAHNARAFDVPFLVKAFSRCNIDIPLDWFFLDTIPLAREVMKSEGSKVPYKVSLQALGDKYDIKQIGTAHRSMSDVKRLSLIFQRLTFELKLPLSGILEKAFSHLDTTSTKKKKN
ncbi:hypothetical protein K2173_027216 [Erythroxylum novogranatense]|uniref:Exonuclease domain-containing protein n=1 Tax=Erythroxylum novogranatense TaxID=1862640 RepID=A0AAV8U187_9ROSI|nr:hypothetical protein K2173_027216 [Erythroxylum novogranatense]